MANKEFTIKVNGVEKSVKSTDKLKDSLSPVEAIYMEL